MRTDNVIPFARLQAAQILANPECFANVSLIDLARRVTNNKPPSVTPPHAPTGPEAA